MHMRMVLEVLAPSVQDSGDADVGAKVLGIAGNSGERLGCGREQQSVKLGLVLVGDGSERSRQREHHMEVGYWQEFSLARCHPCLSSRPLALRAVAVATGVIGNARVGAVLAALDMTAQRCGAANLDRGHDAPLGQAQMRLVGGAPSGAVAAEDIRHFELWTRHCRASVRRCRCQVQLFERALDLPDEVDGNVGIARGRLDVPMSEQVLDDANVDALFK